MANERRLIDADRLATALELLAKHEDEFRQSVILGVVSTIKASPKVDAIEVVRCKDCKHWNNPCICEVHSERPDQYSTGHTVYMEPDDFCSYGERKLSAIETGLSNWEHCCPL